jgi:hypothetical protein
MTEQNLEEGKRIDAVKKHLKKHKNKYLLGAGIAAAGVGAYAGNEMIKDASRRRKNEDIRNLDSQTEKQTRAINKEIRHAQDVVDDYRGRLDKRKEYKNASRILRELEIDRRNIINDSRKKTNRIQQR